MAPAAIDEMEVDNPLPAAKENCATPRSSGEEAEGQRAGTGSALGREPAAILREHVQPPPPTSLPHAVRRQSILSPLPPPTDNRSSIDNSRPLPSTSSHPCSREAKSPSVNQKLASSSPEPAPAAASTPSSIKLDKEVARLKEVIEETSPAALHRVLREQWRQFLFIPYDKEHVSFILRACLKNSASSVNERILKEFISLGSHRPGVIQRALRNATPEQVANFLLPDILDQAITQRLNNAPAREIINWLARARRLGYSEDDIVDEDDESVIPNIPSRPRSQNENAVVSDGSVLRPHPDPVLYRDPPLAGREKNVENSKVQLQPLVPNRQERTVQANAPVYTQPSLPPRILRASMGNGQLSCPHCQYKFTKFSGYNYHMSKNVCNRDPKDNSKHSCPNCAQHFPTQQVMNYHVINKVCEGDDDGTASPSGQLHEEAAANQYNSRTLPLPISRPTFSTAPRPSAIQAEQPRLPSQYQFQPQGGAQMQIPRPPLYTPSAPASHAINYTSPALQTKKANLDIRQSPSELPVAKLAELNRQLEEQEVRYTAQCAAVAADLSPEERERRLASLKNGNASRKSQIRKTFGVTLRMREKDKRARNAAMASASSSSSRPRLDDFRAPNSTAVLPSSSPAVLARTAPPTSGFSPINVPRNIPTPNMNNPITQQSPSYAIRPPQPQANNPLLHANQGPGSSFGVLRATNQPRPGNHMTPSTYVHKPHSNTPQHPAKRQRMSSEEPNGSPYSAPAPSQGNSSSNVMVAISSEDAASIYSKKRVSVSAAQAKWEAFQPKNKSRERKEVSADATDVGTPADEAASATVLGDRPGSRGKAISIVSSSDGEIEPLKSGAGAVDKDRPLPSTEVENHDEDTESDGNAPEEKPQAVARPGGSARGGFMARRGGKRT